MQTKYKYTALFLNDTELYQKVKVFRTKCLPIQPNYPHVTFFYQPEEVDESLFGTQATVFVTGYGNNGQNEGLQVSLQIEEPRLKALADMIKVPHITLSFEKKANAVNTKDLIFHPIKPFVINGTFGGFLSDSCKVVLQSN